MTTNRNVRSIVIAALLANAVALQSAFANVYLNEVRVHGDEAVELYNSDVTAIDVSGWRITGTDGEFTVPDGSWIAPQGYLWLTGLGQIMSDLGGETSVIDLTFNDVKDRVFYGWEGTAPVPPASPTATIARAPDASFATPPSPAPDTDGNVWAIALNPTPGATNATRIPMMGTSLRILNVVLTTSAVTSIFLENPSSNLPVYLGGWYVTAAAGDIVHIPPYTIPSGTVAQLNVPAAFDTYSSGLIYLHQMDGTRVAQTDPAGEGARGPSLPTIDTTWGNVKATFR